MKKILVTGGTGFIGRQLVPFLLDKGFEVHCVSRSGGPGSGSLTWHKCDLLDHSEHKKIVAAIRPSHLVHLAWYVSPDDYKTSPENFRWVRASLDLIRDFAESGGRRAVIAGTCLEYDWSQGICPESGRILPSTAYGACKNSLHESARQYAAQAGIEYAWGRLFFLYGPHEYPERLAPSVICSLLKGREMTCLNGGLVRDFLHVRDAAAAFACLADGCITGPVNIASGDPVAIKDFVAKIAAMLDRRDLVRYAEPSGSEPALVAADAGRLKNEAGWEPGFSLEQGLEQTINWWKGHLDS